MQDMDHACTRRRKPTAMERWHFSDPSFRSDAQLTSVGQKRIKRVGWKGVAIELVLQESSREGKAWAADPRHEGGGEERTMWEEMWVEYVQEYVSISLEAQLLSRLAHLVHKGSLIAVSEGLEFHLIPADS
jgi:hypothetical protein